MEMKYQIKDLIDSMAKIANEAAANLGIPQYTEETLKAEMMNFMMYLFASDGTIQWNETAIISDLLNPIWTPETLKNHTREHNVCWTELGSKVPTVLKIMVANDNAMLEENPSVDDAPSLVVELYKILAETLISANGEEHANRRRNCQTYIDRMENYINSNSTRRKSSQFQTAPDTEKVNQCLAELHSLIGLSEVKNEVDSLINLMKISRIRAERGMAIPGISQHLVFSGNPGTGKTTVARIIGKVYHALGILSKGHLIEVDRSGLVAGYVGQTAIKTQEVIQSALGGILFIDEAYSLTPGHAAENDFGQEAIDTILKAMEDHRDDFVVIVAGYSNLMPKFIESNPGLKSRFNKYIEFPDYTGDELFAIFLAFLKKSEYTISPDACDYLKNYLNDLYQNRGLNFGNARDVRNIFERVIAHQANRLSHESTLSNEDIATITIDDLIGAIS